MSSFHVHAELFQSPTQLPGFWIFMYHVSPFTYLIGGWAGTGLADRSVVCAPNALAVFDPPSGESCEEYLSRYFYIGEHRDVC
jgi:ABC-type multidrug transport system permease subunit